MKAISSVFELSTAIDVYSFGECMYDQDCFTGNRMYPCELPTKLAGAVELANLRLTFYHSTLAHKYLLTFGNSALQCI